MRPLRHPCIPLRLHMRHPNSAVNALVQRPSFNVHIQQPPLLQLPKSSRTDHLRTASVPPNLHRLVPLHLPCLVGPLIFGYSRMRW